MIRTFTNRFYRLSRRQVIFIIIADWAILFIEQSCSCSATVSLCRMCKLCLKWNIITTALMYILRGNSSRGIANRICSGLNQNFTFYLFILLLNLETILLGQYVYPIIETSTFGNEIAVFQRYCLTQHMSTGADMKGFQGASGPPCSHPGDLWPPLKSQEGTQSDTFISSLVSLNFFFNASDNLPVI